MSTLSDQIRLVVRTRIERARQEGATLLNITSGDIVRELHLKNRTPVVCQVLASKKLRDENNVVLEERQGPPSGQSTTMIYTYRLGPVNEVEQRQDAFMALRGAGKSMYASLGGAETFHKTEREAFNP
jgi:hypothetical protein